MKDSDSYKEDYCHDFERGDHIMRWTNILIYPIQVHGIVLSSGHDIVSIVDFGASAPKPQNSQIQDSENLEDMVNSEDKAMMKACEQYRKDQVGGTDRIHIITLTEEHEIKRWKKINYGEDLSRQKDWRWWRKADDKDQCEEENGKKEIEIFEKTVTNDNLVKEGGTCENDIINPMDDSIPNSTDLHPRTKSSWWKSCIANKDDATESKGETPNSRTAQETQREVPSLPKSDPEQLVLSRVRYLLNNPQELPPHNILFSNSECIAVWCKTGRWSTLQASIFLYSTAAGNLKTMVLGSTGVATATTTVTVPAGGIAGWFGMTTTSTVSLLSVQPWLIPLLAGYGLIAVGTPLILARKAKERWEATTIRLNDGFWGNADSDVYVEAIKSWSNLE